MADDGLLIPIQFTLEEARAALAQLEAQARAAGQRAGDGVSKGVEGGLAGLKKTMGPARETAMFFTQALGEFGPAGRTAQIAISGIAGAILGGGGVLAALSLAQAAARLVSDAWMEHGEAAKKAAQDYEALIARVDQYASGVESTAAVAAARGRARELKQLAQEQAAEQEKLGKEYGDLVDRLEEARAARSRARDVATIKSTKEKVFFLEGEELRLRDSLSKIDDTYLNRRAEVNKKYDDEQNSKARATIDARAQLMKEAHEAAWQLEVDYANRKSALLAQADQAGLSERELVELEYQRTMAGLREGDVASQEAALKIRNIKIAALDKAQYSERLALVAEFRAEILAGEAEQKAKLDAIRDQFANDMRSTFQNATASALGFFRPVLVQSAAYTRAMKEAGKGSQATADLSAAAFAAMTQEFMANIAIQAGTKAIFEVAEGYAAVGRYDYPSATAHFASATSYGIVAGMAGATAIVIGQTRGMTRAERDSVDAATGGAAGDLGGTTGGGREYGGGTGGGGSSGPITVRETIYIVSGSEFETPAETARRAARTMDLVKKLDLQRRAS